MSPSPMAFCLLVLMRARKATPPDHSTRVRSFLSLLTAPTTSSHRWRRQGGRIQDQVGSHRISDGHPDERRRADCRVRLAAIASGRNAPFRLTVPRSRRCPTVGCTARDRPNSSNVTEMSFPDAGLQVRKTPSLVTTNGEILPRSWLLCAHDCGHTF